MSRQPSSPALKFNAGECRWDYILPKVSHQTLVGDQPFTSQQFERAECRHGLHGKDARADGLKNRKVREIPDSTSGPALPGRDGRKHDLPLVVGTLARWAAFVTNAAWNYI